jgi:hypothetical protein
MGDDDLLVSVIAVVFVVVILAAVMWVVSNNERHVDDKIEQCIASGGTPIVVGHQISSDYKGCSYGQG